MIQIALENPEDDDINEEDDNLYNNLQDQHLVSADSNANIDKNIEFDHFHSYKIFPFFLRKEKKLLYYKANKKHIVM